MDWLQEQLLVWIPSDILLWLLVGYKNSYQYKYQVIYYCGFWLVTRTVVVTTWISLQHLVSRNKIMKDYLATYQEPDFLADEVSIGVLTKSGVWTTTLADNMSNCEKYFAYCGPGICNRSWAVCISLQAMGFGWTPLFDWKGQFFPSFYSWCGAFGPNMHMITNKLKPACVQTGWGLWETQEVILNTQCTNHSHQGEGDPKRRVPQCSLPKLRVDVTPRSKSNPGPLCCCVSGKRSPRW